MSEGSPIEMKLDLLRQIVCDCGSMLVAFSGSPGSAIVAMIARQQLGTRSLACIGVSPSMRTRDLDEAIELATKIGVRYRLIETQELLDQRYAANPSNRCYYCKSELHRRLRDLAQLERWTVVADGNHLEDDGLHQHSFASARQHAIRSPLVEAGLSAREVHAAAVTLGLPPRSRPAMSCLSSRVPRGTPITAELLRQIEAQEQGQVNAPGTPFIELHVRTSTAGWAAHA